MRRQRNDGSALRAPLFVAAGAHQRTFGTLLGKQRALLLLLLLSAHLVDCRQVCKLAPPSLSHCGWGDIVDGPYCGHFHAHLWRRHLWRLMGARWMDNGLVLLGCGQKQKQQQQQQQKQQHCLSSAPDPTKAASNGEILPVILAPSESNVRLKLA